MAISATYLVQQALTLCRGYAFDMPLHHYLKEQFRSRKQMGARDRRWMREMIYCWYRPGTSLKSLPDEQRLLISFFLSHKEADQLAIILATDFPGFLLDDLKLPVSEKIKMVNEQFPVFKMAAIFPFPEHVSDLVDLPLFTEGLLVQPKVWLRTTTDKKSKIREELTKAGIAFEEYIEYPLTISVSPQAALNTLDFMMKGWAEIQDLSSQNTGSLYLPQKNEHWYDCCAASGGKSLLLKSLEPSVRLTVSDNRESILVNLRERFKKSGIRTEKSFVADLTQGFPTELRPGTLDGIIADVPCSGSGTWSRSPEQLQIFKVEEIAKFTSVQKKILTHIASILKTGKPLIYSTCSIFKEENEGIIEFAEKELGLKCETMQLFQGTKLGADTLFAARLRR